MMSGYDFLKSQVLTCWQNADSDWDVVMSSGRVFQTQGPATVKARLPTVESLTGGTSRRLVPAERNSLQASLDNLICCVSKLCKRRNSCYECKKLILISAIGSLLIIVLHEFAWLFILLVCLSRVVGLPPVHKLFWMYTDHSAALVWDLFWCISPIFNFFT